MVPGGGHIVSGYDARIYALMLSATTFVLNFTLIQPIFSLFLTSRGITVVQLGILLSIQSFIPLIIIIQLSGVVVKVDRLRSMIIGLLRAPTCYRGTQPEASATG